MKKLTLLLLSVLILACVQAQGPKDFTIRSVTDASQFTLSKARGKLVVLHFLLKTECPYCIRHTAEYFQKAATRPEIVQVFIKPDTKDEIKAWADQLATKSAVQYPIYQDENAGLAKQYDIPDGYAFHGQTVHYPALIILDKTGKEVFRYVGKNNTDRFSFDRLISKIEELGL